MYLERKYDDKCSSESGFKKRVGELEAEKTKAQAERDLFEGKMRSADEKFRASEKALEEAKARIKTLENEMNGLKAKNPALERDIQRLQESVDDRDKLLAARDKELKEARLKIEDLALITKQKNYIQN